MAMQKRMLTRTMSLFGQWPQMHLHVRLQTCGNRKEDDGHVAPEYDSECSDLDEAEY